MDARVAHVQLELDGQTITEVIACRVVEGMSRPTAATVEVATAEEPAYGRMLLRPARLGITVAGADARLWSLVLGAVRFLGTEQGTPRYALELHDSLHRLRFIEATRKFRDLPTEKIVSTLLDESRIPHAWRTAQSKGSRPWCVQFRETNHDFIVRLLAEEGIYYTFDPEGGVSFGDTSQSAPPVDGRSRFDLVEAGDALAHGEGGIHEFSRGRRAAPGTVTVNDHDWKRPDLSLLSTSAAGRDAELEVYEPSAGFRDPAQGTRIARQRLEARRVDAEYVEGKSGVLSFAPGRKFTFGDEAGAMFAGEYLLCQVEHTMKSSAAAGASITAVYENAFSAIPASVPFRPPLPPKPRAAGHQTAMVRGPGGSEIHTDTHGRFKAQFHWDREAVGSDQDSRWMRVLQESSNSMFLGRVGWEMTVAYENGDPDRPVGVARNINGVMGPQYPQPASKNMMAMQTPSSPASGGFSEVKLDDSAGGQSFDMRAERDFSGIVKHDQSETIGQNETHLVGKNLARTVRATQKVTVGKDSVTTVNGQHRLFVAKDRTSKVGGSESVDATGPMSTTVKGSEKEKVGSIRLTVTGSLASPKEVLQTLIPNPKTALLDVAKGAAGDLFAAARQATIGDVESLVGQAKGAAGAIQGLPGAAQGAAGAVGQVGSAQGLAGIAAAGQGALSGAQGLGQSLQSLPGTVSGAIGAAKALPGAIGSVPGNLKETALAMPDALKATGQKALQDLKNMIPSPAAALDAFLKGSINRSVGKSMSRMVGGALVSAAVSDYGIKSSKAYIETIGGVKLTSVRGTLERKAGKAIVTTVGGKLLRVSKNNMSFTSATSKWNVGQSVELASKTSVTLHADTVRLRAGAGIAMGNDVVIEVTPAKVALTGDVKIDSKRVTFLGNSLNVTNPPTPEELAAEAAAEAAAPPPPNANAPAPPPKKPGKSGAQRKSDKKNDKKADAPGGGQPGEQTSEPPAVVGGGVASGPAPGELTYVDGVMVRACKGGAGCEGAEEAQRNLALAVNRARSFGMSIAAGVLNNWLVAGGDMRLPMDWLLGFGPVRAAEDQTQTEYANRLLKKAFSLPDGAKQKWNGRINDDRPLEAPINTDLVKWISVLRQLTAPFRSELFWAGAMSKIISYGDFALARNGNSVELTGTIHHRWVDYYEFDAGKPVILPVFRPRLNPVEYDDAEFLPVRNCCGAGDFHLWQDWRRPVKATVVKVDDMFIPESLSIGFKSGPEWGSRERLILPPPESPHSYKYPGWS